MNGRAGSQIKTLQTLQGRDDGRAIPVRCLRLHYCHNRQAERPFPTSPSVAHQRLLNMPRRIQTGYFSTFELTWLAVKVKLINLQSVACAQQIGK
jgi:hypothetical protein